MTALLEANDVVVEYPGHGFRGKPFRALHSVNLTIDRGETLGLVGESGSGKTTLGRAILGLVQPTAGSIRFEGEETVGVSREKRRQLSRDIQVIFQDPYSSMNPVMTIEQILVEPLMVHNISSLSDARKKAARMLERVNLPASSLGRLPREFSGGQRQRIAIARALMVDPKLVVCDEPVSALDVSTQDRVVKLLIELQKEFDIAYLFIAHDLALVRSMSDRVCVMYRGEIVEAGDAEVIGSRPVHPYTKRLLLAAPVPDPKLQRSRRLARHALLAEQAASNIQLEEMTV